MRLLLVICLFVVNTINIVKGQQVWSDWQELYNDGAITVSIKFRLINSCESESSPSSHYAYKFSGNLRFSKKYLTYKSDFINCNGQLFYHQRSVKLADIAEDGSLESMDFRFEARELITPFYDIELSDNEKFSSGVKAMPNSIAADKIVADSIVCKNNATTLKISGGSLGIKADWNWYSGSCGGAKLGKGESIVVYPDIKTNYFVRAEGELNTTSCVQISIDVRENSIDPIEIISSKSNPVCEGTAITLSVSGGQLTTDAQWQWYEGDCSVKLYKSGQSIVYIPTNSKYVSARAEGVCINKKCTSIFIESNLKSKPPLFIDKPYNSSIERNQKISLNISGGVLGANAQWEWYKNDCLSGKKLGVGPSITIKPGKEDIYFVKAKGLCNETECIQTKITTKNIHGFDNIYSEKARKFLGIGFGIGLEGIHVSDKANYSLYDDHTGSTYNDSALISFNGIGIKSEFCFYPIIKPVFSLGFIGAYTFGYIPSALPDGEVSDASEVSSEYNSFSKIDIGSELSLGFKPVKFIFKANGILQSNNVEIVVTDANQEEIYTLNNDINRVTISGGIRTGRYSRFRENQPKKANNFDFIYSLSNYYPTTSLEVVQNDLKNISKWNSGIGFSWWRQSSMKLQFEAIWNKIDMPVENNSDSKIYPYYQLTFLISKEWFY